MISTSSAPGSDQEAGGSNPLARPYFPSRFIRLRRVLLHDGSSKLGTLGTTLGTCAEISNPSQFCPPLLVCTARPRGASSTVCYRLVRVPSQKRMRSSGVRFYGARSTESRKHESPLSVAQLFQGGVQATSQEIRLRERIPVLVVKQESGSALSQYFLSISARAGQRSTSLRPPWVLRKLLTFLCGLSGECRAC